MNDKPLGRPPWRIDGARLLDDDGNVLALLEEPHAAGGAVAAHLWAAPYLAEALYDLALAVVDLPGGAPKQTSQPLLNAYTALVAAGWGKPELDGIGEGVQP